MCVYDERVNIWIRIALGRAYNTYTNTARAVRAVYVQVGICGAQSRSLTLKPQTHDKAPSTTAQHTVTHTRTNSVSACGARRETRAKL